MRKAEVWLVNLDPTLGAEIQKTRPAVIVNEDAIGVLPLARDRAADKLARPLCDRGLDGADRAGSIQRLEQAIGSRCLSDPLGGARTVCRLYRAGFGAKPGGYLESHPDRDRGIIGRKTFRVWRNEVSTRKVLLYIKKGLHGCKPFALKMMLEYVLYVHHDPA